MAEAEATVDAVATAGQDLLQEESELLSMKRSEPGATVDVPCQRGLLHLPPKQGSTAQHLRRRRTSSERGIIALLLREGDWKLSRTGQITVRAPEKIAEAL